METAVDATFRARYEQRGRALELMGQNIAGLNREELFAVIGYLLELNGGPIEPQAPLGSPKGAETGAEDPPKNDGLYEG